MSTSIRIAKLMGPYAGIGAIVLGLLHWFLDISYIGLHIFFGSVVTASLLTAGIVALSRRRMRGLGVLAVALAPIVPIFGMTQMNILVGGFHWVVRVAHLLVGVAAVGLIERIGDRYARIAVAEHPTASGTASAA